MSNTSRNWKEFDYESWKMVVSPTQVETANDCMRKWWFQKVQRIPEQARDFTQLGEVFHQVCERWLLADDTGRDATGEPVDLFPDDWGTTITNSQQAIVRRVFQCMVDEGVLRRTPGREIEKSFQIPVLEDDKVSMIGFVDVWTPQGIEDHKTSKSRRWLMSRQGMSKSIQMMSYATAWVLEQQARLAEADQSPVVELRHNQGIVDPSDLYVRPTQIDVSVKTISDFWKETIIPLVREMLHWKEAGLTAVSWDKVAGPKLKGACTKYGGCPFTGICTRTESVDDYVTRITRYNQHFTASKAQDKTMSEDLLAKLAARKKARAVTTSAVATVESPSVEEPKDDSQEILSAAPWAQKACKACEGSGINTQGDACPMCTRLSVKEGLNVSDFLLTAVDGAVQILRSGRVVASVEIASLAKVADNTKPLPEKTRKTKSRMTEIREEKKEVAEETPAVEEQDKKPQKAKTKKGFTMLYGLPKRHNGKVIDLNLVMQEFGEKLATEWNTDSFWAINAFKRREALAHKAQEIAHSFGTALVIVTSDQRDLADLAAALEPYATNVYGSIL